MKLNLFVCGWLVLLLPIWGFAEPVPAAKSPALSNVVILVIRHAEKPDDGPGLSAEGEARAKAYTNYFKTFTLDGQALKLDYLFAAADSKESQRPRLTLEPTGKAFGLAIDTRFKNKNFQQLADELQAQPHGNAILIAWHHEKIPALLRALGADSAQVLPNNKWPDAQFGWVIQLRYDQDGKLLEAKRIKEKLMLDDLK